MVGASEIAGAGISAANVVVPHLKALFESDEGAKRQFQRALKESMIDATLGADTASPFRRGLGGLWRTVSRKGGRDAKIRIALDAINSDGLIQKVLDGLLATENVEGSWIEALRRNLGSQAMAAADTDPDGWAKVRDEFRFRGAHLKNSDPPSWIPIWASAVAETFWLEVHESPILRAIVGAIQEAEDRVFDRTVAIRQAEASEGLNRVIAAGLALIAAAIATGTLLDEDSLGALLKTLGID